MTKYCPTCENEYQDNFTTCPEDDETLLEAPSMRLERAETVDIYAAANELEAKRIVVILADVDVPSQIFRPQVSQLPSLGDSHFVIAVPHAEKERAVRLINDARNDAVISNTGLFL